MSRIRQRWRPDDAPRLGQKYHSWRDFTDRVARPLVEIDGNDPRAEAWYMALMQEPSPYYFAVALVIADNVLREVEAIARGALTDADLAKDRPEYFKVTELHTIWKRVRRFISTNPR